MVSTLTTAKRGSKMTTRKTTRIDMHVHTPGSDGLGSPDDFVDYARAAKLDGLVITDHHRTYTAQGLEVARALRKAGLLAFHGCEYSTAWGHMLVYGVDVELCSWGYYPDPRLVIRDVRAAGGVCVPSHPYYGFKRTCGDRVKQLRGVAGIETANGQAAVGYPEKNRLAAQAAAEVGFATFGGSDAHLAQNVGTCYTRFDAVIRTERDFLQAMKRGLVRAVTSRKRIEKQILRRYAVLKEPQILAPIPDSSLDSAEETGQISLDGNRYGLSWRGPTDPIRH